MVPIKDNKLTYKPKKENEIKLSSYLKKIKDVMSTTSNDKSQVKQRGETNGESYRSRKQTLLFMNENNFNNFENVSVFRQPSRKRDLKQK